MSISRDRLYRVSHAALIGANLLVFVALLATAIFIHLENGWAKPVFRASEEAFVHGTIGTELMPLAVAQVLPDLFPEDFQPGGPQAGDWIAQFGFQRTGEAADKGALPIGFAVSHYRPGSGAASPVPFVGFSCALCHTTRIRETADDPGRLLYGPGSVSLNLFAWLDAFQSAILAREPAAPGGAASREPPYRLTLTTISKAYAAKTGRELGIAERIMIWAWLREIRGRIQAGLPRFDAPFGDGRSRDPAVAPTGPTRTQPFRTLVRTVLDRPGNDMPVYTKIATVYSEDLRRRAQFDGTIADLYARSSLAALAAGATITNMALPEIAHNIRSASDFTSTLRPPRYRDMFVSAAAGLDPARLERGHAVYRQYCTACHGDREAVGGAWKNGPQTGEVVPFATIGTDPERVLFRHYDELAERMFELFPASHPFHFPREDIWPQPGEEQNVAIRGYVNAPLDGMFLRAPYLHNGSVLTLAELINLKKRRDVFYRGDNFYDPEDVGFRSPDEADTRNYFRFDTSVRGNSNRGHDYPWAYDDPARNTDDLAALLDYLKSL
ncbi:cytochrome c [Mesorhizobium sp. BR1-1-16]|uniref:c-type cytochrome n=1 Tax=Mesorhizobium sp. BR1-1-16 TaxID=2876653 RepID=UPI001CC9F4CE|nr:cytochrome c [Mesorhizobium sp. BR1-1-16]MBZ9938948.1 cytochrome c [Mesorhizobium sp. BR1-1-16]